MIDALIAKSGLIIVYLGCALEGDTVAITSGLLAHHPLLPLWPTPGPGAGRRMRRDFEK